MRNAGAILAHIQYIDTFINVEKRPLLKSPSLVYKTAAFYKEHFEWNHDDI